MDVWNEYTAEDVAQHHSETDCWLIIGADGAKKVYDVTAFLEDHPGGPELLLDLGGQDVQDEFEGIGHTSDARAMLDELCIGVLKEEAHASALREAKKIARLSLLTSPEFSSRQAPTAMGRWNPLALAAVLAALVVGVLSIAIARWQAKQ